MSAPMNSDPSVGREILLSAKRRYEQAIERATQVVRSNKVPPAGRDTRGAGEPAKQDQSSRRPASLPEDYPYQTMVICAGCGLPWYGGHVCLTTSTGRHARNEGPGGCVPWEQAHRHEEALREIRDADPVDMALDPNWPARIARAALDEQGES